MMQGAALIVGIGSTMIVAAAALVTVVVVGVASDAGARGVVRDILVARHDMLEVDTDQRNDTRELGNQKQPQKHVAKSALHDAQRYHLIGLATRRISATRS
jgi:hypothetical protein